MELRFQPALPRPFYDFQCIVQQDQGFFSSLGDLTCRGQEGDGKPRDLSVIKKAIASTGGVLLHDEGRPTEYAAVEPFGYVFAHS